MVSFEQLSAHVTVAVAVSAGVFGLVAVAGLIAEWDLVAASDTLFVIAVLLFVLAAVMTRPTVSRRRAIQRAMAEEESGDRGSSDADDPERPIPTATQKNQLEWGIRIALVAVVLFCVSFLLHLL